MSDAAHSSPWIIEADEQTFQQDAVERSRELPVVVDFWAAWCQPCRMLAPLLEQLAREYDGKFLLVKIETDRAPGIAAGFGVQSIPAVYALRDGKMLDFFVGVLPEPQIRAWIDRLLPTPAEQLVAEAKALATSDPPAAEAKLKEAAALDANLAAPRIVLAEMLIGQDRLDEARAVFAELEERGFLEPEAEKIKAQLHLAAQSGKADELDELRAATKKNPKDLKARLDLAKGLAAAGKSEEALQSALSVVQAGDKNYVEPARELMVDLFRLLEDQSELVTEYRRKLSTALY